MHTGISILNVCFLIVLVATNPIFQKVLQQTHPEVRCEQIGNRKALTDTSKYVQRNENINSRILTPNQISSTCQTSPENYLPCNILKLVYNKILDDPITKDTIKDIKQNNNADVLYQTSQIPSIVNSFILMPPDSIYNYMKSIKNDDCPECSFTSPKFCTRVKKNADENIDNKLESDPGSRFTERKTIRKDKKNRRYAQKKSDGLNYFNNKLVTETTDINDDQKARLKKTTKRYSQNKNKTNTDLKVFSENGNKNQDVFKNTEKSKNIANRKKKNEIIENVFKISNEEGNQKNPNNNPKKSISVKELNQISKSHIKTYDQPNEQRHQLKKIKIDKSMKTSQLKEKNPEYQKERQINAGNKKRGRNERYFPFGPSLQWPNIPHNDDMYKYMNSFLSNYQMHNTKLNNGSPFNYNNIYQLSQPPYPWGNRNTRKSKLYRRKKNRHDYRKRLNKKKLNRRKNYAENQLIAGEIIENENLEATAPAISLKTLINPRFDTAETISANLKSPEFEVIEELDSTINLDDLTSNNNTFVEAINFNSHPSFIIGMEGDVPIIFENGFIDDYYPDFTADNEILDNKETTSKYNGDKYHYVSNQLVDFEDYVKANKRLALLNMNKSSNFLFSDNDVIRDVEPKSSKDEEVKGVIKFQSPPLLDNPDFRTRKIDSIDKYEPYYYHNTFQDPEETNMHSIDDKSVVYSTSIFSKHMKNKLFNDIEDDTKSKWKKVKDSNVETVHARSKLAKYGFIF